MTEATTTSLPDSHPLASGRTSGSRLVRALRGDRPETLPVWFMRQAGRSLPEYRELRIGTAMLDACLDPEMASEITLQPVRRHHVDAGIFFSDIVIPLKLAGVGVDIVAGRGPVLEKPVRTAADVAALPSLDPAALEPIRQAVARTVAELGDTPLIGFAGAPFTLAAYLVEGGPSKDHIAARGLMHADPDAWDALMRWCAEITGVFLHAQVMAGASAAQLFDSWAGGLSLADYTQRVAPASALVAIRPEHLMPAGDADAEGVGEVTLIEDLGAEGVVYFTVAGQNLVTLLPAAQAAALDLGSRFAYALRPGTAALFSPATGQRVGEAQAAETALA